MWLSSSSDSETNSRSFGMRPCLRRLRRSRLAYAVCLTGALWCLQSVLIGLTPNEEAEPAADEPDVHDQLYSVNRSRCAEKTNLVYIKQMKCASQTLVSIFRRFGLQRRLSFVLPVKGRIYLGWPWPLKPGYHRPSKARGYNILCEHAVFDQAALRKVMPPDAVYITSLREPFSQFKSMFNYYEFKEILNITAPNPLEEYLLHLEHYEPIYVSHKVSARRYCIPDGFHMSRNLLAYNLGFPTGFLPGTADMSSNATFVADFVSRLDRALDLVLIVEHLHESLVLLRRSMCWRTEDIVYLPRNVGGRYAYRAESGRRLVDAHRRLSAVDYALYEHFNRTLWRRVAGAAPDFADELRYFDGVAGDVRRFCDDAAAGRTGRGAFVGFGATDWGDEFVVNAEFCALLREDLLERIKRRWDVAEPTLTQPVPDRKFC